MECQTEQPHDLLSLVTSAIHLFAIAQQRVLVWSARSIDTLFNISQTSTFTLLAPSLPCLDVWLYISHNKAHLIFALLPQRLVDDLLEEGCGAARTGTEIDEGVLIDI